MILQYGKLFNIILISFNLPNPILKSAQNTEDQAPLQDPPRERKLQKSDLFATNATLGMDEKGSGKCTALTLLVSFMSRTSYQTMA